MIGSPLLDTSPDSRAARSARTPAEKSAAARRIARTTVRRPGAQKPGFCWRDTGGRAVSSEIVGARGLSNRSRCWAGPRTRPTVRRRSLRPAVERARVPAASFSWTRPAAPSRALDAGDHDRAVAVELPLLGDLDRTVPRSRACRAPLVTTIPPAAASVDPTSVPSAADCARSFAVAANSVDGAGAGRSLLDAVLTWPTEGCWDAGVAVGGAADAGEGGGAGGAAGAGGGIAPRGGRRDSGSTYASPLVRTPRCTYGTGSSASPEGPGSATVELSSTTAP